MSPLAHAAGTFATHAVAAARCSLRAWACALIALAAVIVPAAAAHAEAPSLLITSPESGSVSNDQRPIFSGTSSAGFEDENPVVVRVFEGTPAENHLKSGLVEKPTASYGPIWAAPATAPLPQGTYTAVAEQEGEEGEVGTSGPVVFMIDTTAPTPTILAPASGSSQVGGSQTVSGTAGGEAGDEATVTVRLFAGLQAGGQQPLETLAVPVTGGAWSATFGGLAPGTYTVRAAESDRAGNVGVSVPVSFTLQAPAAGPAANLPSAAFVWVPSAPHPHEIVTIVSTSTDLSAPITALEWSVGTPQRFAPGTQVLTATFPSAGAFPVSLRALDANGNSNVGTRTIEVTNAPLPLMQPFPVVRIVGSLTHSGARISLLSVQAPISARVTVTCRGRSCPAKSVSHLASASKHRQVSGTALITFRRFARTLRAGVVLEIRVTKAGEVGKWTRFLIRRGHVPVRSDNCLWSSSPTPTNCP